MNQTHLPHPLGSSLSFGVCGGQHHFKEGVCKPVEKCPSGFSLLLAQKRGNLLKQMPDFQGTRSEPPNQTQNAERDPVKPSSALSQEPEGSEPLLTLGAGQDRCTEADGSGLEASNAEILCAVSGMHGKHVICLPCLHQLDGNFPGVRLPSFCFMETF